jgi:Protein of unknown function (DUF2761)
MQTNHTPNTPGHIDSRTGRVAITVAQAAQRDGVDSPLYLYDQRAAEAGMDGWRVVDGVDPHTKGGAFDLWFESCSVPKTVAGDCCVYIGKKESAAMAAKAAAAAAVEAKPTVAQEAIANADAYLQNAVLPSYTQLRAALADLLVHCANRGVNTGSEMDHGAVKEARELMGRHDRTVAGDFRA